MEAAAKDELSTANSLKRKCSDLQAFDASMKVHTGFQIWTDVAPAVKEDPSLMFARCLVHPDSTPDTLVCSQVYPPSDNHTFSVPAANAWNTNSQIDPMTYGDIGMLPQTNIPCVLDYLRHRFLNNQIYSTAEPLLIAVNPFKDLGNATDAVIGEYVRAPDSLKVPPHVFATARKALENMHDYKYSQTVIVSGESGAGKTEATKQMMRYFAYTTSGLKDSTIQTAIMAANPVLEAFGNAKTVRNNNSSRFGRFMQLDVAEKGGIRHGSIVAFLLEKSRIVTQEPEERCYHIFYQFLKGANADMKRKFKLLPLNEYKYINDKCLDVPGINDIEDFNEVCQSFKHMGLSEEQINCIWSLLSGILLLGNIEFTAITKDGIDDAASISNINVFNDACDLLFLDRNALQDVFLTKITTAGNNVITGPRKLADAQVLQTSLSKAIYEKLFLWLIRNLNRSIEPAGGFNKFIGMLDIFGFEVFKNNSLEQLFINITNEMLQTNFIDIVFKREAALYESEGIACPTLEYTSNAPIISLLCAKTKSILSNLEDQCLAPGGADEKFVSGCNTQLKDCPNYTICKVGNINFTVVHTIGPISYNATGFLFKNKDALCAEMVECVNASSNEICKALFENVTVTRGKLAKGQLIGSQFLAQLEALMALINTTDPHFVRCVKPNETKQPLDFNCVKVLIQLHALSIIEALQLRKLGYSYRRTFVDFIDQYKYINLGIAQSKEDPRQIAKKLLESANVASDCYAFGKTMLFMTQKTAKELTKIQRERLSMWEPLADVIDALLWRIKERRNLLESVSDIVRLQAWFRRQIASAHVTPAPQALPTN
ncbi:bifunctional P-loop containing nucleoside triphosphate hydrolase/Myosin head [Babesia duncani]|uniref:Myosin-A n=1 Tax=Babesia duncani TaxID=323732 RepID=A0AAD9PM77_9APIC|nr:bifunctional P-loop containing nucleoside triphosphate hydrolase/Myosin head [Babesia duncani]KAK2197444.1 bifunctional P-loop containing nucleoside triphosphate hydrolase/Myosin head [Babesia duncani]